MNSNNTKSVSYTNLCSAMPQAVHCNSSPFFCMEYVYHCFFQHFNKILFRLIKIKSTMFQKVPNFPQLLMGLNFPIVKLTTTFLLPLPFAENYPSLASQTIFFCIEQILKQRRTTIFNLRVMLPTRQFHVQS